MGSKTASVQTLNARKDKQKNKEAKEARAFLDRNLLDIKTIRANVELMDLVKWVEKEVPNGGPLHIIIDDGSYSDDDIEWCQDRLKTECGVDYKKFDRILQLLKPLTVEQREMLVDGNIMTELLFDLLYNQALTGD